jgi:hypothetical protein
MSQSFGRRAVNQPSKTPPPAMSKFARPPAKIQAAKHAETSVDEELRD